MRRRRRVCVDANHAAAHAAYALSDVAVVFPITPSTPMSHHVEEWAAAGRRNCLGNPGRPVVVRQMQSEAGVAGALHGALRAGALATTFTSSQGLLLLVPTLHRIAGDALPLVVHLASRALAQDGVTIFADHSDVYALRGTGAAILSSHSVQEAADLSLAAHIAAVTARVPVVHTFEGMELSHEAASCDLVPYPSVAAHLTPRAAIADFRATAAVSPRAPRSSGVVLGRETFWQQAESSNARLLALPRLFQASFDRVATLTGRKRSLFEYVGAQDAHSVVVAMGTGAQTTELAVSRLRASGQRVGVLKVHLFRPWSADAFLAALPATTTRVAVLDRAYEPTASGEPLFLDVAATLHRSRPAVRTVLGGRYGVGGHDFTVDMAEAVFAELSSATPRQRFSVGITDDVTHLSLPPVQSPQRSSPLIWHDKQRPLQCVFWGIGGDGTVSANRAAAEIVCSERGAEDVTAQVIFHFDAHKTGGVTVSHLRFFPGDQQTLYHGSIGRGEADFVACHVPAYLAKYDVFEALREGGTVLLNVPWSADAAELARHLPPQAMSTIARKKAHLFVIDASAIAHDAGLGNHTSLVLAAAFFKLTGVAGPAERAAELLKAAASATYGKRTAESATSVAATNAAAIDAAISSIHRVDYPSSWASIADLSPATSNTSEPGHVQDIVRPLQQMKGMDLPVSVFAKHSPAGLSPQGTAAFEKRGLAEKIPTWDPARCVQCNRCSLACPHAAIRPFLLRPDSPLAQSLATLPAAGGKTASGLRYRLQTSPLDCTACGACVKACPTKALSMQQLLPQQLIEDATWRALVTPGAAVEHGPEDATGKITARSSQLARPLLEFASSCAGCPQPVYIKLLTQLFGKRLVIANGIGCSTVWGGTGWCSPYTVGADGRGPVWTCSLFENTAEYGFGIAVGMASRRSALHDLAQQVVTGHASGLSSGLRSALGEWCKMWQQNGPAADSAADAAERAVVAESAKRNVMSKADRTVVDQLLEARDLFRRQSVWIVGGDGWASDIGFGGLDHVLAHSSSTAPVRMLVLDNELYANTGGQQSKSTPAGAVAKLATHGRMRAKKDLGAYATAMHPGAYVASVCYGADPEQTVRVLQEAEAHTGPSLVVAFTPCVEHQPRGGFNGATAIASMRNAVASGYWPLYHRMPGSRLVFDRPAPAPGPKLDEFLASEGRFASLARAAGKLEATRQREALRRHIAARNAFLQALP